MAKASAPVAERSGAEAAAPATRAILAILATVAAIPRGRLSSYGVVAAAAGLPGRARLVGRVLAQAEAAPGWHRVLNAQGRCAFAEGSDGYQRQLELLAQEGISPSKGRFPLARLRWPQPDNSPLLD